MKNVLSKLHRWLGVPLGLLFMVTFGTGCLTAVEELLERVEHTRANAGYDYRETTIEEDAQAISAILDQKEISQEGQGAKKAIRQIVFPSKDTPYYQVKSRGESVVYSINTLDQRHHLQSGDDGFFRTVLQLHRNFLLGKEGLWGIEGKYYAAWVGLIAALISLLGLWLWWPLRKSFSAKDLMPRGKKRKHFYYNHMTSGVVLLVVIVVFALTGASMSYRAFTQQLLGVEREKASTIKPVLIEASWQSWLSAAYAQMPEEAQLRQIRFPRQTRAAGNKVSFRDNNNRGNKSRDNIPSRVDTGQKILDFRFNAPGDWLGLEGSSVKIDKASSQLVGVRLFRDLPVAEKIYTMLKPLHTGHDLSAVYVVALLVLSLLGTVMVLSGLVSFIVKKRKWSRLKRWMQFALTKDSKRESTA